ncbi:MAG TPA: phage regulatory protein/antirepressor Ant [Xanthobacteraceae bacterium]|nr:phage regulatory protein/antirepressor Ant [Xanthobacteraceae bacterium]
MAWLRIDNTWINGRKVPAVKVAALRVTLAGYSPTSDQNWLYGWVDQRVISGKQYDFKFIDGDKAYSIRVDAALEIAKHFRVSCSIEGDRLVVDSVAHGASAPALYPLIPLAELTAGRESVEPRAAAPASRIAPLPAVMTDGVQTMSTLEIEELTGKEHKNILADVRKMLADLGKAAAEFSATAIVDGPNGSKRTIPIFNLPKRECLILVSGYSVELRERIIDRWLELEAAVAKPGLIDPRDPKSLRAQLRLEMDRADELEAQNAALTVANEAMTEDVEAFKRIAESDGLSSAWPAAKTLGVGPKFLTSWMRANGWAYRYVDQFIAMQDKIDAGLMESKVVQYLNRKRGDYVNIARAFITPRGITVLAKHPDIVAERKRAAMSRPVADEAPLLDYAA